ncbi:MAG TPA: biotin transporter BioY [Gemmatimonadaceae bacterium]|jgi:biotin transport system substrate-specific component
MTSLTSVAPRNRQLTVVGVVGFAAIVAVGAQIAIPIPGTPVPFTLQPLAVVLAGLCLGPVAGAASMVLYLLVGALGAPVFSPIGAPGVLRLLGPTGGYLFAYPAAAAITGLVARRFPAFGGRMLGAFLGIATLYVGGVAQLELLTGSLERAAAMGTVPFILADLGKVVVAAAISSTRSLRTRT